MIRRAIRLDAKHGLDAFNALVAAAQTGFGAFIPAYLAGHGWTQAQIGALLTAQTVAMMLLQVPAGALVDATAARRLLLGTAVALLGAAALLLAVLPWPVPVTLALVLQAAASGVIYPAIAALSLALVGRPHLSERLGRNASFAAAGSGVGAAVMGLFATLLTERAVFVFTALLAALAVTSLLLTARTRPRRIGSHAPPPAEEVAPMHPLELLRDRRVLVYAGCVVLFNLASAALLPVAAVEVTRRAGPGAGMLIAAWIIIPQVVVALFSPLAGRLAERIGRRPVLLAGFLALPLRAGLFALIGNPYALTPVQVLEGAAGAAFGVMTPLLANDLTRGTNRASLCLALFGLAGALGSALSTSLAGATASLLGVPVAFGLMAGAGVLAVLTVALFLPETRRMPAPRHAPSTRRAKRGSKGRGSGA